MERAEWRDETRLKSKIEAALEDGDRERSVDGNVWIEIADAKRRRRELGEEGGGRREDTNRGLNTQGRRG